MITMKREAAVRAIRSKLLEMVDEDHSMCQVASEQEIYCRGFKRLSDKELRERYEWLLHRNPTMSRVELEELANRWQLARQIVDRVPIACDAQQIEKDTCSGWDTFDSPTIARFYKELIGDDVTVVD